MRFSERVTIILDSGIQLKSDSLRSIGVYNSSQCWALWVPRTTGNQPSWNASDSGLDSLGAHQLVVSPIHPVSWPYLLRVEFVIADKPGTLEKATELLAEFNLCILQQRQAPAGFRHSVWTAIVEAVEVREKFQELKERFDLKHPTPKERYNKLKKTSALANRISKRLITACAGVEGAPRQRSSG